MNPFDGMAHTLSRLTNPLPRAHQAADETAAEPASKSAAIRRLLSERGPLPSNSIAVELDIEGGAGLVSALMANDIRKGRIERVDGRYRLVESWGEQLQSELNDAAVFLRRNGYIVTRRAA